MIESSKNHRNSPLLIPIAGGKGGVGKSVVAANLAVALALLGKTTVAIDLDLGGSNLHSFLGLPNKFPGIGDYVKSPDKLLTEFMVSTPYDNLFFIPGDGVSPFMANITFHQKRHLTKEIQNLPADFIIMDLGAGTSFNVLDIFAIGDRGLLVSTPEFPAMVSMLGFLKNLLLRRIERETKKNKKIHLLLDEILRRPLNNEPLSIRMLRDELSEADEEAGELIDEICENSRPGIIFNMGDGPDDLEVIPRFNKGLSKGLSLEADYLGFIFNDDKVRASVKKKKPLPALYPDCPAFKEITQVARRLVKFGAGKIDNSAQRLLESTRKFYEKKIACGNREA